VVEELEEVEEVEVGSFLGFLGFREFVEGFRIVFWDSRSKVFIFGVFGFCEFEMS